MEARKAGLLPFQVGTGGQAPPENAGAGGEAVCRGGTTTASSPLPSPVASGGVRQDRPQPTAHFQLPKQKKHVRGMIKAQRTEGAASDWTAAVLSPGPAAWRMLKASSGFSTARQKHEIGRRPQSRILSA